MEKLKKLVQMVVESDMGITLTIHSHVESVDVYHIVSDTHVFNRNCYYAGDLEGTDDEYTTTIDKLIIELENYIKENGK